jgi:drug/metabolite transporter (DMT)-like permease
VGANRNPRRGYLLALLNMLISGVAIFVNSLGVRTFDDSTLYTALKNAVAGVVVLAIVLASPPRRDEFARLSPRQWLLLSVVALIGGSLSYALYFRGLQLTTAVTASLIDHGQFLLTAALAAIFLGERFGSGVWAALIVLLAGLSLGLGVGAVRLDAGALYVTAATVLFAADFALMKFLLKGVSPSVVMLFKLAIGSALLVAFTAATGRLGAAAGLSLQQWGFIGVTGLILLAFTLTSIHGLRNASATALTAIPAGAPIVTTLLVLISRRAAVPAGRWLGLALVLAAVLVVFVLGRRKETGKCRQERPRRPAG